MYSNIIYYLYVLNAFIFVVSSCYRYLQCRIVSNVGTRYITEIFMYLLHLGARLEIEKGAGSSKAKYKSGPLRTTVFYASR